MQVNCSFFNLLFELEFFNTKCFLMWNLCVLCGLKINLYNVY